MTDQPAWLADYRPGSFRGVPFVTQGSERSGGRRFETHEYPYRDVPLAEDLGRRARRFAIEVFVQGADYRTARDRLIDALEAEGPGTLIHPFHGTLSVIAGGYGCRESTEDGGIAFFAIEFGESGLTVAQPVAQDTTAAVGSAADDAEEDAPARFASRFSVDDVAAFVQDAAIDVVKASVAVALIAGGLQGGVGPALRAFDVGLALLPASVAALVRAPLSLAASIVGLVQSVSALGGSSRNRIAGLSLLVKFGDDIAPVPSSIGGTSVATPDRLRQRDNQVAFVELVQTVATAELVRAIAVSTIASYDDAVALRDATLDLVETRIFAAADAGHDDVADQLDALLRVMVADVTARSGALARVYGLRLLATEPSLVISARLYGAGRDLFALDADLVARNRVRHPLFVTGGQTLSVLEASGG